MEQSWQPSYVAQHGTSTEWTYDKLLKDVLVSKENTVLFLLGCGVLNPKPLCPRCREFMNLSRCTKADFNEELYFRCQRKSLDFQTGSEFWVSSVCMMGWGFSPQASFKSYAELSFS